MLVAAAVLPHPPLLIPAVAGDATGELDDLRHACGVAIERLMGSDPDVLLVVGGASEEGVFDAGATGSLARFGLGLGGRLPGTPVKEREAPAGGPNQQELPLSLTVAAFLLSARSVDMPLRGYAVDHHTSSSKAQHLGAELVDLFPRVAMVVMGDGSACLDAKAPGYIVNGAQDWQKHVDAVLAAADFEAVAQLTEADADRFWVAGRAAWQVLAGAALSKTNNEAKTAASLRWAPAIHYASAPYGVQYLVASFRRTDEG
jgi:hypothetical protein